MRKNNALLKILSNPIVIRRYYSPKYSRSIPEAVSTARAIKFSEWGIVIIVSGTLILLILVMSFRVNGQIHRLTEEQQKHQQVAEERNYWQGVTTQYPGYRDAYFRLALLEYQLGEEDKALTAVNESIRLDPRFEAGKLLREKMLGE